MSDPNLALPTQPNILENIREGMTVHDSSGKDFGKVELVYLGEDAGHVQPYGPGAPTVNDPTKRPASFVTNFVRAAFGDDVLPEILRTRLLKEGFIRVDAAGLFAADRYVIRGQIGSVTGDDVHLNVTRDELLKR